jgi:hypothetical protein
VADVDFSQRLEFEVPGTEDRIHARFTVLGGKVHSTYTFRAGETWSVSSETITTDFTVTAIGTDGHDTLYVAGSQWDARRGSPPSGTIFEVWRLEPPAYESGPPPRLVTSRPEATRLPEGVRPRANRIQLLVGIRGGADEAFLVFARDSRDLFRCQVETGRFDLVASPRARSGGILEPALDHGWNHLTARVHRTEGHVYRLFVATCLPPPPEDVMILLLRDTNADGAIDSTEVMDGWDWRQRGYHRAESWASF